MSGNQMILLGGSQAPAVDPFFYSVTSLLHGDGTNGGQNNTFLDSSTNNFTITRNGNTTQGSFSPFSQTGWGNYFDGTGDYLIITSGLTNQFHPGSAFTFEGFFYINDTADEAPFYVGGSTVDWNASTGVLYQLYISGGTLYWQFNSGGAPVSMTTPAPAKDQWVHIAVGYNGTTTRMWVNGTSVATSTSSYTVPTYTAVSIGAQRNGGAPYTGYASNLRFVKGTDVYGAGNTSITVPTTPLTAITNTQLLTCQANRFLDASSNAFAITANGNTSVQPFSPFNPITPYSTSSIGGSGYFDGSGDWLNGPATGQFAPTGNFTISMWIYPTSFAASFYVLAGSWNTGTSNEWLIQYDNTGAIRFLTTTDSTFSAAGVIKLNQWQFISISRTGSTLTGYVNGTSFRSYTLTGTVGVATKVVYIGAQQGTTWPYIGYMADFRLVDGSAESATPPTSPATAISGTNMLLNYTNGAIFDNAAVADYETVGNAQISTSVKKYGTGSMAFDGTGDWLTTASRPIVSLTGDFTIECWVYPTSVATTYQGIYSTTGTSSSDIQVQLNTNQIRLSSYTAEIAKGGALQANTWTHIAVCRAAGVVKLFQNGTVVASAANTTAWVAGTAVIGNVFVNSYPLTGYIDDLRISNGVARYPYNFTPPTAEFPNIGGTVTLTADPYFDYTTLLLPGNGTNGAQNNTFLDSSTNNFTITRNGNTTQGTFSPFSQTGWGNYFDGTGDYLTTNATQAIPATGDFTIEAWVYPTVSGPGRNIVSQGTTGPSGRLQLNVHTDNTLQFAITSTIVYSSGQVAPNQWNYVAVTRTGSSVAFYINGSAAGTATLSGTVQNTTLSIGAEWSGDPYRWLGYISNVRISNVVRTITAAPTAAFTSDANTVVLTCQANRFIDASSNAYTITRNGDVSVQAFSPFNPTAAWSASTNGGSGYFDGSGDLLSVSSANQIFPSGTQDFSVEFYTYFVSAPSLYPIFVESKEATNGFHIVYINDGGANQNKLGIGVYGVGLITGATFNTYFRQWVHVVATRSGNNFRLFFNGNLVAYASNSQSFVTVGTQTIGAQASGLYPTNAYITNIRTCLGAIPTDYQTSSTTTGTQVFTAPTAPVTTTSQGAFSVAFLANFTNAGIYDATSKNDLETVGNAQISTTQSKFGGSSMYFDGTDDRLPAPASVDIAIGTADFTIEGWFYTASPATNRGLFQISTTAGGLEAGNTNNLAVYCSSSVLGVYYASTFKAGTTSISANTWTHFALVRYSGSTKLYVNGIADGGFGTNADTQNYTGKNVCVGGYFSTSYLWSGYIQDFRITRGIARYTSNFTPPTTAFLTL